MCAFLSVTAIPPEYVTKGALLDIAKLLVITQGKPWKYGVLAGSALTNCLIWATTVVIYV